MGVTKGRGKGRLIKRNCGIWTVLMYECIYDMLKIPVGRPLLQMKSSKKMKVN